MEEIPIELLELALKNPVIRGFLEGLVLKVIAELFMKRQNDPLFLAKSDSAFRQWTQAQSAEEKDAAAQNLRALLSMPG